MKLRILTLQFIMSCFRHCLSYLSFPSASLYTNQLILAFQSAVSVVEPLWYYSTDPSISEAS